jgi:peptidoglycan/LPS O-acetylase OafA/YrhL
VIARYSYGIYLSHFFAILVAVHELRNYSMPVRIGGFLAVFLVVPFVEYHLLEEPMIRLGAKLARKIESGPAPRIDERLLSLEPAP